MILNTKHLRPQGKETRPHQLLNMRREAPLPLSESHAFLPAAAFRSSFLAPLTQKVAEGLYIPKRGAFRYPAGIS